MSSESFLVDEFLELVFHLPFQALDAVVFGVEVPKIVESGLEVPKGLDGFLVLAARGDRCLLEEGLDLWLLVLCVGVMCDVEFFFGVSPGLCLEERKEDV